MKPQLKHSYKQQLEDAKQMIKDRRLEDAFRALETAHILGQRYVAPHTLSHLYMLQVGFLRKDLKEIIGQLIRIPLGILGSLIGIVPTGNTGGSNVSAFRKMDIPPELKHLID